MAAALPGLAARGHQLALWSETDRPKDRSPLPMDPTHPWWCAEDLGMEAALSRLRDWRPDVLYVHGLLDPVLERRLIDLAPSVFFAHTYYGTCISGAKTLTVPRARPCAYRFGWKCLLRYYPRRTGGLNPATMVREYAKQTQRLQNLRACRMVVVLSEHMRSELVRHGLAPDRVVRLPPPPIQLHDSAGDAAVRRSGPAQAEPPGWHLIFVGRMDPLKGGSLLLEAAPRVARELGTPLRLTFVGDGPARERWEAQARALDVLGAAVSVRFTGWLRQPDLREAYRSADLLIMPSVWPEPFGLVGLEAGAFGVPCVAFAVGGIPEWLTDGGNGTLASGDPPTADGLTRAMVRALSDPAAYQRLVSGALDRARQLGAGNRHVDAVEAALLAVASGAPA